MRRLVLALAACALAGLTLPPPTAGALAQAGMRVEPDQTVEKEFPPIPANDPAPATPATKPVNPNDCKTSAACDTIPLEIVTPATLAEADEFFVTVELIWQTPTTPGVHQGGPAEVGETAVNDLDLYVWEDPQGEKEVASSATNKTPEKVRMFRPVKGRYQIVVANYVGPNTGYKLRVTYKSEKIESPFESLEPGYTPPPPPPLEAPITTPLDMSEEPVVAPPVAAAPAPVASPAPSPAPSIEPATVEPDADFAAGADSDLTEQLAAPPESTVLKQRQTVAAGPPKPASGSALVFWLVGLPLALVAGAGLWLARRGSGILRLR